MLEMFWIATETVLAVAWVAAQRGCGLPPAFDALEEIPYGTTNVHDGVPLGETPMHVDGWRGNVTRGAWYDTEAAWRPDL